MMPVMTTSLGLPRGKRHESRFLSHHIGSALYQSPRLVSNWRIWSWVEMFWSRRSGRNQALALAPLVVRVAPFHVTTREGSETGRSWIAIRASPFEEYVVVVLEPEAKVLPVSRSASASPIGRSWSMS